MSHLHSVHDDDLCFVIDSSSKEIVHEHDDPIIISKNSHNSERFTFELPRYIEGHDMLECNAVQVHYINISSSNKNNQNVGIYEVADLQINPDNPETLLCSWLLSQNATKYIGSLSFTLRFACMSGYQVDYLWNTTVFSAVTIADSIDNSNVVAVRYADILEKWYMELMLSGNAAATKNTLGIADALMEKLETEDLKKVMAPLENVPTQTNSVVQSVSSEIYRNQIFADHSTALGMSNTVGYKGYYVSCIDVENKIIYLTDSKVYPVTDPTLRNTECDLSTAPDYAIKDQFCLKSSTATYLQAGIIEKIDKGIITYIGDLSNFMTDSLCYFVVERKPSKGAVIVPRQCSYVEGCRNISCGDYSHAEGSDTTASGHNSHAEGRITTASGTASHAEGTGSKASGYGSHAEGDNTIASKHYSHAEGQKTTASGIASHAEGNNTKATNSYSHAEGSSTTASGTSSHAEGQTTTASGSYAHAEGYRTTASSLGAHAEGYNTEAHAQGSHAEGNQSIASGSGSHAEGHNTTASNTAAHAEGDNTTASGTSSHAEGNQSIASGSGSHAEGNKTTASGTSSHAEGQNTTASGTSSHAEGQNTTASGIGAHAEGNNTKATHSYSHAEGYNNTASGSSSHVGGAHSTSVGACSFAHGDSCNANAEGSVALGMGSSTSASANAKGQCAVGVYNEYENTNALFMVGNGTVSNRSNAFEIRSNGRGSSANVSMVLGGVEMTPSDITRAVCGQYIGTGSTAYSLSFAFVPKYVRIIEETTTFNHMLDIYPGIPFSQYYGPSTTTENHNWQSDGSTFSLDTQVLTITTGSTSYNFNASGKTYRYIAW